jgi:NAD(P)-dependent dehydrogenase (short-subunit alcohol dehydrogenase family)
MRILITGASRGIGRALVKHYVKAGHEVWAGCRNPEVWQAPVAAHLHPFKLDVSDLEMIQQAAAGIQSGLDLIINNAGVAAGREQPFGRLDYPAWQEAFVVNTLGPVRIAEAFLDHLSKSQQGKFVTVSSQMASMTKPGRGAYGYRSTKAAVNKVMQLLTEDTKNFSIACLTLHPGWVRTDMGGSGADISVEQSVTGMCQVIANLDMENTGSFRTWQGDVHPW